MVVLAHGAGAGMESELRIEHLQSIKTRTLIVQGVGDWLGSKEEVVSYGVWKKIRFPWLPDGDHSFKPRKLSGRTREDNWNDAIRIVAEFARHQTTERRTLSMMTLEIFSDYI